MSGRKVGRKDWRQDVNAKKLVFYFFFYWFFFCFCFSFFIFFIILFRNVFKRFSFCLSIIHSFSYGFLVLFFLINSVISVFFFPLWFLYFLSFAFFLNLSLWKWHRSSFVVHLLWRVPVKNRFVSGIKREAQIF